MEIQTNKEISQNNQIDQTKSSQTINDSQLQSFIQIPQSIKQDSSNVQLQNTSLPIEKHSRKAFAILKSKQNIEYIDVDEFYIGRKKNIGNEKSADGDDSFTKTKYKSNYVFSIGNSRRISRLAVKIYWSNSCWMLKNLSSVKIFVNSHPVDVSDFPVFLGDVNVIMIRNVKFYFIRSAKK